VFVLFKLIWHCDFLEFNTCEYNSHSSMADTVDLCLFCLYCFSHHFYFVIYISYRHTFVWHGYLINWCLCMASAQRHISTFHRWYVTFLTLTLFFVSQHSVTLLVSFTATNGASRNWSESSASSGAARRSCPTAPQSPTVKSSVFCRSDSSKPRYDKLPCTSRDPSIRDASCGT